MWNHAHVSWEGEQLARDIAQLLQEKKLLLWERKHEIDDLVDEAQALSCTAKMLRQYAFANQLHRRRLQLRLNKMDHRLKRLHRDYYTVKQKVIELISSTMADQTKKKKDYEQIIDALHAQVGKQKQGSTKEQGTTLRARLWRNAAWCSSHCGLRGT